MLNVAFALTILLYAAFTIMLGATPFSPINFIYLFLVTYSLLWFSSAHLYLKPNNAIHFIFASSYPIIGVGIGILINMPPNVGLVAVWYVMSAIPFIGGGLLLISIGMLMLFIRAKQ